MLPKICAFVVALLIGVGVANGTRTEDCLATCQQTCHQKEGKQLVILGPKSAPKYFKTWAAAREACKKKGGDLATKLTEEEMKFVYSSLWSKYKGKQLLWIGGHMNEHATELNHKDSYEWLDGTPIPADYDFWAIYQPQDYAGINYKCMALHPSRERKGLGNWGPALYSQRCNVNWPALCEIPDKRHKYFAVNPDQ